MTYSETFHDTSIKCLSHWRTDGISYTIMWFCKCWEASGLTPLSCSYVPPKVKGDFRPKTKSQSYLSLHDYRYQQVPPSVRCPTIACIWYLSHLAPSCQPCSVSLMTRPQGPTVPVYQMQTQTTQPLPRYSQYTVRLMAPRVWRTLASATQALGPTFGNHRIYQLQPAKTESAPNVIRLLLVETECPPKVPIYPHSAPKPKPKFGRPLTMCLRCAYNDNSIWFFCNLNIYRLTAEPFGIWSWPRCRSVRLA